MGLRRTGKTTLLDLSLQRLQESTENIFLVVKVDLLEWLLRLQREKGYTTLEKELDFYFWFHLNKEFERAIHQQIGEIFPKQQTEKVYEKLDWLIEAAREKEPSIRFVLAFDEADYFGHAVFRKYFQRDESFDVIPGRLLNLVTRYEMVMILVHDNIRVVWQQELVNAYYDMTSSHMLSEYRYFRTHLLDRSDTDGLLKNGPLSFTKLAEETVWAFTGGYASLIQLLYRRLIEYKNQQWSNDDTQKLSAVTVEAVKEVVRQEVYDRENEIENMTSYLLHSFDGSELRLMLLLAQEGFIDPNTAILTIPYDASWQQLTQLNQKATQLFPDELDMQKLQHALASLIDKQLLTRVQINQTVTTHLRWRVGWLYIYLKSASFDIMLGKLQPVLARFSSSDFAA